jgi:Sigma-70 region 2
MLRDPDAIIDEVYRSDWGRIVASLIRLVNDFDVAEEAVQEAFAAALTQWRSSGVPESPQAWIVQTARHKAIDRIRRRTRFSEKLESYAASGLITAIEEPEHDTSEIPDDRLRLIFTCCHPALASETPRSGGSSRWTCRIATAAPVIEAGMEHQGTVCLLGYLRQLLERNGLAIMSTLPEGAETLSTSRKYSALLEVAEAIVFHRDLPTLFHDLAGRLHRVVRFDYLALILRDDPTSTMRFHLLETSQPVSPPPAPASLPEKDGPAWWVWQNQQPLIISNLEEDPRWVKFRERTKLAPRKLGRGGRVLMLRNLS